MDSKNNKKEKKAKARSKGASLFDNKIVWIVVGIVVAVVSLSFAGWGALDDKTKDAISANVVNFSSLVGKEWTGIVDQVKGLAQELLDDPGRPGLHLRMRGQRGLYPVLFVPGIISTGLEVWEAKPCLEKYIRKRLWGSVGMFQPLLFNADCWVEHLRLDPDTGMDPDGIRLRAAEGMEAADYFVTGYYIWGMIIQNLADIGYDPNIMYMGAYDWRLGFEELEKRDLYFSRLKLWIELQKSKTGKRTVILGHSMGAAVSMYFLNWVESPLGGNGGPKWVDEHIEAFASLAGALLGVPKSMSSILSGEMRDTAQLGLIMGHFANSLVTPQNRSDMFRSWGSIYSLLPKGGKAIWERLVRFGNVTENGDTYLQLLRSGTPPYVTRRLKRHSVGSRLVPNPGPEHWANPLETKLPNAPTTKLYCMYGVGKETEAGYFYKLENGAYSINTTVNGEEEIFNRTATSGVVEGPGDGTVPLLSLGFMCAKGWASNGKPHPQRNPAGLPVVTREYLHNPHLIEGAKINIQGGRRTADHVEIMGNHEFISDILHIVSGAGPTQSRFESDILSRVASIDI